MNQNLSGREQEILTLIMDETASSVVDLSRILGVSSVTVRSSLNALADKGVVVRTWGGAAPAFHPEILERQRQRTEQKVRIAKAAAALVADGDTIMIEAGTTTAMVARYLFGIRDLSVVSNNNLVIPYARANPSLRLTIVGGEFRPNSESTVGPVALDQLRKFHVRFAFIGTDGFSLERGLTTHLVDGAEIVKRMAECAETTVLLADSAKFGRSGFVAVLPLESVDRLITDSELPGEAATSIRDANINLDLV